MTMWRPDLEAVDGPIYQALAGAIADAVGRGELAAGERLPTQRELAQCLGVALTTVTRGYAEAERRGLVRGEVGRGTFVRGARATPIVRDAGPVDLRPNSLLPYPLLPELGERMARVVERGDPLELFGYGPHRGAMRHREAGAMWMARLGLDTSPTDVLVTAGSQHAMATVFATILDPGDTLLVESVTYAGMKALANLLHVRLEPLPMDAQGILPDALRAACARGATALYCQPIVQNPLSTVMPEARLREVAAVAEAFGIAVVEDDSYGFVLPGGPRLVAFAPRTYYLAGTSKSLLPGLRIGFVRAPADMADRLEATISSTVYLASPLTAGIVSEWIDDGTADRVMQWKREEFLERGRLVSGILGEWEYQTHSGSPHGWLMLPEPWTVRDFVAQSAMRGVHVAPADEFAVGREAPHAVRLCTGPVATRETLERAARTLSAMLREPPEPRKTVA